MIKVSRIFTADEAYRMDHTAPGQDSGAPLYDVTLNGTYPDDFYGPKGLQYYADGQEGAMDAQSYSIICSAHSKPNARIQIYRSVPKGLNSQELLVTYESDKRFIQKYGKLPPIVSPKCPPSALTQFGQTERQKASDYFQWLYDQVQELKSKPIEEEQKIAINPGDWVTINKAYAKQHGEGFSEGQKILTKTVSAKELYTAGDSFHEWGYSPT